MKLKRAAFRHIEAEIYSYRDTLEAIKEFRQMILLAGREEELARVSGDRYADSAVERRATKLADSILLREMDRITKAIEDTYAATREEGRRVIWVKYGLAIKWEPPTEIRAQIEGQNRFDMRARVMAEASGMDESTFHRYRTGFVFGVSERLGWY